MGDHAVSPPARLVPFLPFKFFLFNSPKPSVSHLKEQKSKMVIAIVIFTTHLPPGIPGWTSFCILMPVWAQASLFAPFPLSLRLGHSHTSPWGALEEATTPQLWLRGLRPSSGAGARGLPGRKSAHPSKADITNNYFCKGNPILTSPSQGWREIWAGLWPTSLLLSPLAQDTPPQGMSPAARNAGGVGAACPA